jgi:peptide/nickel transport system permease protein
MLVYVVQRVGAIVVMVAVMSVLVFGATHLLPGNVVTMILGEYATPEAQAAIEKKLGLHDPLPVQYWRWASAFLRGDMGESLVTQQPVAKVVGAALGQSLVLASVALASVTLIGIGLGILAAVNKGKPLDHAVSLFGYLGIAVPEFFWAVILIVVFAGAFHWLPSSGYAPPGAGLGRFLSHLILPVVTLALTLIAHVLRMTRSSLLEVLGSDYVKVARARGLPERTVLVRHALRNGLLPTITVLANDVGFLIGGIVVIESVFGYPGLGRHLLSAIEHHDLPMLQAMVLILTVIYALANLGADLLYACFNPKIRYGRAVS